jgi:hypothetical protein
MLLKSGVMNLMKSPELAKEFTRLGWPDELALCIGIVEPICVALYVVPRTSVLGAILLTGYLGGATATNVRIGGPFLAPVIIGIVVWLGLYRHEARAAGDLSATRLKPCCLTFGLSATSPPLF